MIFKKIISHSISHKSDKNVIKSSNSYDFQWLILEFYKKEIRQSHFLTKKLKTLRNR